MTQSYYNTSKGGPVKWELPLMPLLELDNEDQQKEYIERAKKLLSQKVSLTKIADKLNTSLTTLKSRLDKYGVEYRLGRSIDNTGLQYALKFEEVAAFRDWLHSQGFKVSESKAVNVLFNVRVAQKTKAIRVTVNAMGTRQIVMPTGVICHYKIWSKIK